MDDDNGKVFEVLRARFALVNQYCDTTFEPKTFNSLRKFRMGGDDVLDYIVCYYTTADKEGGLDHWHYVSYGLSDIYGNWIIDPENTESEKSGFGFELTIRVKYELEHNGYPPTWPLDLLQQLAKYVFVNKTLITPGDHITWHTGLDGNQSITSHMLTINDYTIPTLETSTGKVEYVQIVGAAYEEIQASQHWSALSVLEIFKSYPETGGQSLVTDTRRTKTIFELDPTVEKQICDGIARDGSNLNGVSVKVLWTDKAWLLYGDENVHLLNSSDRKRFGKRLDASDFFRRCGSPDDVEQVATLLSKTKVDATPVEGDTSKSHSPESPEGLECPILHYSNVHLTMDLEAAMLIPLALKGRVYHNRHFTFRNPGAPEDGVTFVPNEMLGAFAMKGKPFAAKGSWLHIHLDEETCDTIVHDVTTFFSLKEKWQQSFPRTFLWPKAQFAITIVNQQD